MHITRKVSPPNNTCHAAVVICDLIDILIEAFYGIPQFHSLVFRHFLSGFECLDLDLYYLAV